MPRQMVRNVDAALEVGRYPNLLPNGGFEWWQRGGGPYTASGAGVICADRWYIQSRGSATGTCQRDTSDIDYAAASLGGAGGAMAVTCTATNASSSDTANSLTVMSMNLNEAMAANGIGGPTMLLNSPCSYLIRVKSDTANSVVVPYVYVGSNNSFVLGPTYTLAAATWTTVTMTGTQPSGGAWYFGIFFHTVATYKLDNATMVAGTQPMLYQALPVAVDLAICQRYYEKHGPGPNYPQAHGWSGGASGYLGTSFTFHVTKAATPTVTIGGTFGLQFANAPAAFGATLDGVMIQATTTGAGDAYWFSNSSGYFTVEANP